MHISRIIIDIHLSNLDEYIDVIHWHLQQDKVQFKKQVATYTKTLSPSQIDELYDFYQADYRLLNEEFPNILWESVLISMYSIVDFELSRLCESLQKKHSATKELKDRRKGSLLTRIEQYLTIDLGLTFPSGSSEWKELNSIALLRNSIVHNGSHIKGKKARDLRKYIQTKPTLSIGTIDRVILSEKYCRDSMKVIIRFTKDLFDNHLK